MAPPFFFLIECFKDKLNFKRQLPKVMETGEHSVRVSASGAAFALEEVKQAPWNYHSFQCEEDLPPP